MNWKPFGDWILIKISERILSTGRSCQVCFVIHMRYKRLHDCKSSSKRLNIFVVSRLSAKSATWISHQLTRVQFPLLNFQFSTILTFTYKCIRICLKLFYLIGPFRTKLNKFVEQIFNLRIQPVNYPVFLLSLFLFLSITW